MKRVKILIACPEFLETGLPLPNSMGFEYDQIIELRGGGYTLGYYNEFSSYFARPETGYGLPKDLKKEMWDSFRRAISELTKNGEVNIKKVDFVTEIPCETWIARLRNRKIPVKGWNAQAPETIHAVLEEIQKSRTKNQQSKIRLTGLKIDEFQILV